MKHAEIEEFSKQRKKEQRMKIDKIKEAARKQMQDRQDKKSKKILSENYNYDERVSST